MRVTHYGVHSGRLRPEPGDWDEVSFLHMAEPRTSHAQALVAAFEKDRSWHRVAVASFVVVGLTPSMAAWLAEDRRADLYPYVARLVHDPAFTDALPAFAEPNVGRTDFAAPPFEWLHPLALAGSVAAVLSAGGAYDDGPPPTQALAVTSGWIAELIDDRYEDVRIAYSKGAWADWFYNVFEPWDHTWLITDIHHRRATLLCVTDSD